jgi:branched-chain amino acid transport system ATP-binding protein
MVALLEVKALKAFYGQTQSLYDIGFEIEAGGITTLLGANGAGKTTTLRAICNMVRTEGSVRFDGKDLNGMPTEEIVRLRIAHVPEGRGTFTTLTVDENLRIAAYTRKDKQGVRDELERVFSYFPRLKERVQQQAGTLSGGADAGDRPCPDAEATPDAARRAVVRPGAVDRGRDLPHPATHQQGGGGEHPAG